MNKLNGWERAWLVVAVAWAALVLAWSSLSPPQSPARLRQQESALLGDLHDYPTEDPRRVEINRDGQKFTAVGTVEVHDMAKLEQLNNKIKTYRYDLAVYIVNSTAFWAFPLITIYVIGLAVAWVRAGFVAKAR